MERSSHSRSVILCVDDEEMGLAVRKRVLERAGYAVLTATSAHKALEVFRLNHVDLVLTEHIVPKLIDGPTLAATMKMLKPEVPIAIYSADWTESPEDMRFADTFITKLVSVDELLDAIAGLVHGRRSTATGYDTRLSLARRSNEDQLMRSSYERCSFLPCPAAGKRRALRPRNRR